MTDPTTTTSLKDVLAQRRWVHREWPFPHTIAQNVFTDEFYKELEEDFRRVMGLQAGRQSSPNYDANITLLSEHADGPLKVFLSREWHDMIAAVSGVTTATGDVSAALHHHEPGGRPGWPHNDLNPGWFGGPPPAGDEVRYENAEGVGYHHEPTDPAVTARANVRAVSLLFYLANPPWTPADGGHTGLYPSTAAAEQRQGMYVPPVNNTLMLFECTPFTWHGYAGHSRNERNSVVMWLHRPKQEVLDTWGDASIAYW